MSDSDLSADSLHQALDFSALIALLERILSSGEAISEYELMRWLQAPEQAIFRTDALQDPLLMFRSHFILMHCLYRLREQWQQSNSADLEISALSIRRIAFHPDHSATGVAQHDALAAYYLDLQNLHTEQDDIEQMLNSFWQKMLIPDNQQDDLDLLELSEPVTNQQIRQQYRRLAMQHHPDRGGDESHFCRIQAAFQRLKTRYS